jgi:hypothetical protein
LLLLTLQHNRGFAGCQCRPALNRIRFALESDLLPWVESTEFQVIRLRIDFSIAILFNTTSVMKA